MTRTIHVAHSPDSDDAFMFYALAENKIDTEGLTYIHELQDIESLNQRALRAELEVTAVSIHAYAYLADQYALLPHGASIGDRYGPRLVARTPMTRDDLRGKRIAQSRALYVSVFRTLDVATPLQHRTEIGPRLRLVRVQPDRMLVSRDRRPSLLKACVAVSQRVPDSSIVQPLGQGFLVI